MIETTYIWSNTLMAALFPDSKEKKFFDAVGLPIELRSYFVTHHTQLQRHQKGASAMTAKIVGTACQGRSKIFYSALDR
jgi:hypothetical protein